MDATIEGPTGTTEPSPTNAKSLYVFIPGPDGTVDLFAADFDVLDRQLQWPNACAGRPACRIAMWAFIKSHYADGHLGRYATPELAFDAASRYAQEHVPYYGMQGLLPGYTLSPNGFERA